MRLWSLHPKILDSKGLVALWREALLARKVLEGKTEGYRNHPQLWRFKNYTKPVVAINSYLYFVFLEANKRGFKFSNRIYELEILERIIPVTTGQLEFELRHLISKLKKRDPEHLKKLGTEIETNPIFYVIDGDIEPWEKSKT